MSATFLKKGWGGEKIKIMHIQQNVKKWLNLSGRYNKHSFYYSFTFSVLFEHFYNTNLWLEIRGTCGVTKGFRSSITETARLSRLKTTSFPGKWLPVSPHFFMFYIRLTLQSFSTLEIFHQVCPLAHFPTHVDSRLPRLPRTLWFSNLQEASDKSISSSCDQETNSSPTTAVESQDNPEHKNKGFLFYKYPGQIKQKHWYLLLSCQMGKAKFRSPFRLYIFLLPKFNF